ncbi:MAG: hypothetical protein ACKVVT_18765 [Dehalococcoidia bacterium]
MLRSAPSWWSRPRLPRRLPAVASIAPRAVATTEEDEPREAGRRLRWLLPMAGAAILISGGVALATTMPGVDLGSGSFVTLTDRALVLKPKTPSQLPIEHSAVSSSAPAEAPAPEPAAAAEVAAASAGPIKNLAPSEPPPAAVETATPKPTGTAQATAPTKTPKPTRTATATATASPSPSPSPAATPTATPVPTVDSLFGKSVDAFGRPKSPWSSASWEPTY